MKEMKCLLAIGLVGILAIVGFSGCGDAGGDAKTSPPVSISVDMCSQWYESDVCREVAGSCAFYSDTCAMSVRVDPIGPDEGDESRYMDVLLTGYEVKYIRKDTGVAVPKTFTGNMNAYCEVGSTTEIDLIFCRADMKNMPPLSYLWQYGYELDTGLTMIHTTCIITLWGHTIAGENIVSDPVQFTVNFANYADEEEEE